MTPTPKRNTYPAIGVAETTYSDGWERDDPFTIAAFDSGECCCPSLRRLPNGELLIVYDVQNWIEVPGAPPRKAIRAVRMRRKK